MTTSTAQQRSGAKWPMIVVGLLLLNVGVCFVTVFAAVTAPQAIEPGYYDRAVNWDADRAARPEPEAIGWAAALSASRGAVNLTIANEHGAFIAGASITGACFHAAFASDRRELRFTETAPGVYSAELPADLPGMWEFRLSIDAGSLAARLDRAIDVALTEAP